MRNCRSPRTKLPHERRDRHRPTGGSLKARAARHRAWLRCRSRLMALGENTVPVMTDQQAAPRTRWAVQSTLVIAALPTATPCARLHARNIAHEWGLGDLADTIELVVSELVTNAVQASLDHDGRPRYSADHGLSCIHLRLSTDGLAVLVEVWDETAMLPEPAEPDLDDEGGRGLMLVDALTERWGWELAASGRGKTVWALLRCQELADLELEGQQPPLPRRLPHLAESTTQQVCLVDDPAVLRRVHDGLRRLE